MSASSHEADPPAWDQAQADALIGKYALVGITYLAPDGETVTSQLQFHGRIVSADPNAGIRMQCEGKRAGETFNLPPHLQIFQAANPGVYTLRSTGETVENPELLASWSVHQQAKS